MMVFLSQYWPGFQPIPAGSIYTYRDQGNRIATEYVDGTAGRDNIYLGNMLVASYVSSPLSGTPGWQFYASDHLGSPRFATDIGANVVENRKYWPYGEEAPSSPTSQRLQFCTMERDVEANNYNDHARHHDFNLGRFLSPDLLSGVPGDPQSWNRYSYVLNNPMRYTDPFGLYPDEERAPKPPPDEDCREKEPNCKQPEPTIKHEEHITVKPTGPSEFETARDEFRALASTHSVSPWPRGFGLAISETTDLGVGFAGAGQNGNVGTGLFLGNSWRVTGGAFASLGGFAGGPGWGVSYPTPSAKFAAGIYGGGGASIFVTNARTVGQLKGPFEAYSVNLGWGARLLGVQLARGSDGTWILTYGGPLPGPATGGGYGAAYSHYSTNTWVSGR